MHRYIIFVFGYCCILTEQANAGSPEFETSLSYVSKYNDRGTTVAGEQVWASFSIISGSFNTTLNYARSLGAGRKIYADEIDLNIDYGFDILESIGGNIGVDIINDPASGSFFDVGASNASTIEIYTGLSFDTAFTPTVTAIYDFQLRDFTLEGTLEHNIPMSKNTIFMPSLTAGYAAINNGNGNSYLTGTIALENRISDKVTVFANTSLGTSSRKTFSGFKLQDNAPLPSAIHSSSNIWAQIGISAQF